MRSWGYPVGSSRERLLSQISTASCPVRQAASPQAARSGIADTVITAQKPVRRSRARPAGL